MASSGKARTRREGKIKGREARNEYEGRRGREWVNIVVGREKEN